VHIRSACIFTCFFALTAALPAVGEGRASATIGDLRGVTRYPGGLLPLAHVLVLLHSVDKGTDRAVFSDSDGTFVVENLEPGRYHLSARKVGFVSSSATTVDLAAGQSLTVELPLGANSMVPRSFGSHISPASQASSGPESTLPSPAPQNQGGFFRRFARAYRDDWKGANDNGPTPARRGWPAPVDGPPFPFSDWPYGGSVTIGAPWTQSGPLMQAIWSGKHGDAWKKSGIQIYGWLNFGGNFSTSKSNALGKYANLPTAYDEVPNSIQPDQEVLYIERQPNTVQKDHFDWGFRIAQLWGMDYRFTTSKGIFSSQLLGHVHPDGTFGRQYGYDPVMFYVDLYFPKVAEGMNIRIGRYISLPDIEAQLAPNNYTYSHSLLYTFDCYTQVGLNTTIKLNNHWLIQGGVSPGCETAPWNKIDRKLTGNFCAGYTWREGKDNIYACDNAINDGKYAYNNLNAVYSTWYHKINRDWHSSTEFWYQWERKTPNVGPAAPPESAALLELNANGAFCKNPTVVTCYAPDWAIVNYLEKRIGKHNYLSIRNEYFDDMVGQRTGTKSRYTEHLIGWGHWIGTTILFRPELRFERSYDNPAYQNGSKKNQLTAAGDIIWFF